MFVVRRSSFVVIEVCDTGMGIAPEHQALVFEEFRQVDSELGRQYQGTGLGLPITKRLVELHGGHMWLHSAPGVGSTFAFTLPIAVPISDAPALPAAQDDTISSHTSAHIPLVVVDDDPTSQQILDQYLT